MLRDSIRRWADQEYRAAPDAAAFEALWNHFAEMGWLMASLPEDAGGLGGSAYDAAIVAEEFGRKLVAEPFVEVGVAAAQVLLALAPDRVEAVALGGARPLLAHDEADARGEVDFIETRAVAVDGGYRLTGRKTGVIGAPYADLFLVSARLDGEIALFAVEPAALHLQFFRSVDDRPAANLILDEVTVGADARIGAPGAALPAIARAIAHQLVIESAEAVGAMQAALDLTRDYLLTRKQYGQRIGDFQALRHRLADMFIETEQARSMVLRGIDALDDDAQRSRIASATKARVAQAGTFVTANAIQLHGGIGVTEEYPVGLYFKRLLMFGQRHGTADAHVGIFAAS
jgi:alkylation response protein AidB-like acyl-CoA dehydrogenase